VNEIMPIYEYSCQSCETQFEELVRLGTEDQEVACPKCGEHRAKRLLSVFAGRVGSGGGAAARSSCGGGGFS